jgi:polar amino acid transport system permease protein
MTRLQALIWITVPQAARVITPPLLGMYISTLKLSSLASMIAVYELLHSAQNLIMNTYRPLEVYTTVAVVYLILILPLVLVTRHLEAVKGWRVPPLRHRAPARPGHLPVGG